MAHLALYREFRPKTFDEVIGQDHIVKTLTYQIQTKTISHAYLFCGTRGTGKTSCAKIFAKAVNCLNPKNGSPCGECEVCKKLESGLSLDILEIDAASNNRVDEIRDLREKVGYLPSIGQYKVYIIDEVHMLTDSAFNALLKTLEEPPEHIIFILATTEPDKLPSTILSRCMRFDFKLVGIDDLTNLLSNVLGKLDIKYEPKALELIAKAGNGSVRDTLSVAEMCKAFSGDNITYEAVQNCLGLTDDYTLFEISKAIISKDGAKILQKIDKIYQEGKNFNVLLADLSDYFKNALTYKLANDYDFKVPDNILQNYKYIADNSTEKFLLDCLKKICDSLSQIKYSYNTRVFVETTLLSLFYDDNLEIEMLKQRIANLENGKVVLQGVTQQQVSQPQNMEQKTDIDSNKNIQNKDEQSTAKKVFGDLIGYIRSSGEMMLFVGFNDIKKVVLENQKLILESVSQDAKNLIESYRNLILNYLKPNYNIQEIEVNIYEDADKKMENQLKTMLDGKVEIE